MITLGWGGIYYIYLLEYLQGWVHASSAAHQRELLKNHIFLDLYIYIDVFFVPPSFLETLARLCLNDFKNT